MEGKIEVSDEGKERRYIFYIMGSSSRKVGRALNV
jgi:hypothetical protein